MSAFSYNSCTLPYSFHTDFKVSAVAEDSNTDWYLLKYEIKMQFLLNAQYLSIMNLTGVAANSSPAAMLPILHKTLMHRRKAISYMVNGVQMIPQPQGNNQGSVDAANGPIPLYFNYKELTASTFLCEYAIEASYWNNPSGAGTTNQAGNPVLYNRWTESLSYDNCLYATRSRNGKYIMRSDQLTAQQVDQLRASMCQVGVPPGFLRTKSEYTVDPNGLGIQYSLIDEEQFKMPPAPAYEADGTYAETTTKRGTMRHGVIELTLKGAKTTSQSALISAAVLTATQKMNVAINGQAGLGAPAGLVIGAILDSSTISVKMYKNEVNVKMRCMITPPADGKARFGGVPMMRYDAMVITPNSIPPAQGGIPAYPVFGNNPNLLLQAAAYWDPSVAAVMGANGQFPNRPVVGSLGVQGGQDP